MFGWSSTGCSSFCASCSFRVPDCHQHQQVHRPTGYVLDTFFFETVRLVRAPQLDRLELISSIWATSRAASTRSRRETSRAASDTLFGLPYSWLAIANSERLRDECLVWPSSSVSVSRTLCTNEYEYKNTASVRWTIRLRDQDGGASGGVVEPHQRGKLSVAQDQDRIIIIICVCLLTWNKKGLH